MDIKEYRNSKARHDYEEELKYRLIEIEEQEKKGRENGGSTKGNSQGITGKCR
jgi:hypothetical protein